MKKEPLVTRIKDATIRNPLVTLSCITAGMAIAAVYLYITPSQYESTSVIEPVKPSGIPMVQGPFSSGKTAATEEITSIPFVTEALTGKVEPINYYVEQDFRKKLDTYGFPFVIRHNPLSPGFKEQQYTIKETGDDTYLLTSTIHGFKRSKTGHFGEEIIDRDLAMTISKKKTTPYRSTELMQPPTYSFRIQSPATSAAEMITKGNSIKATEKNGVITLSTLHESPEMAKNITTELTDYFVATRNSIVNASSKTTGTLEEQLAEMATQMEAIEEEIAVYKRENNISDIQYDTEKTMDVMKNLQIQKAELEMNLAALNNISNYLRKNREKNNSNVEYGTISDPVFSEQITLLNSKYEQKELGIASATTDAEIENNPVDELNQKNCEKYNFEWLQELGISAQI